jgi:hypothetical protein
MAENASEVKHVIDQKQAHDDDVHAQQEEAELDGGGELDFAEVSAGHLLFVNVEEGVDDFIGFGGEVLGSEHFLFLLRFRVVGSHKVVGGDDWLSS